LLREIKRSQVILIVVILIVSVFSIALVVSGRQNSHPGSVVWEESEIDGYPIGGSVFYLSDDIIYCVSYGDNLIAVDLEDEEVLWEYTNYETYRGSEMSTDITTVLESNGIVYIGDRSGNVAAIDAENGEEVWRNPLSNRRQVHSLYRSGNNLFVAGEDYIGRDVRVLDIEEGEEIMNHTHGFNAFSVHYEDGIIYSTHRDGDVIAADAETGEKIWEHSYHDEHEVGSLYVEDDVVYSGGAYEVIAFDAEKEEKIWEHTLHSERESSRDHHGINTILVEDDTVYSGCGNREIVAAEKEDGEEIWTYDHHNPLLTMQTCEDELYIGGRGITIREKEGGLLLGMYRSLDNSIQSMTGWISDNFQWIFLGLIIIGSIVGFLAPRKRIRHGPDQDR